MRYLGFLIPFVLAGCVDGYSEATSFPLLGGYVPSNPELAIQAPRETPVEEATVRVAPTPGSRVLVKDVKSLQRAGDLAYNKGQWGASETRITVQGQELLMRRVKSRGYEFAVVRYPSQWGRSKFRKVKGVEVAAVVLQATQCLGSGNIGTKRFTNGQPSQYAIHIVCK